MNEKINVNLDVLIKSLDELKVEYSNLEGTCRLIKECFNRLRETSMQGRTATQMIEICDEWDKINERRLEQINELNVVLNNSYKGYVKVLSEVSQIVGKEG